ncbi:MAG: hypothetical protein HZA54_01555, partial [Planctomycetes bacterium]|nr:hypothetical protein [Planctomycetota bacterium]
MTRSYDSYLSQAAMARGYLTREQVIALLALQAEHHPPRPLADLLRAQGHLTAEQLAQLATDVVVLQGAAGSPASAPANTPVTLTPRGAAARDAGTLVEPPSRPASHPGSSANRPTAPRPAASDAGTLVEPPSPPSSVPGSARPPRAAAPSHAAPVRGTADRSPSPAAA